MTRNDEGDGEDMTKLRRLQILFLEDGQDKGPLKVRSKAVRAWYGDRESRFVSVRGEGKRQQRCEKRDVFFFFGRSVAEMRVCLFRGGRAGRLQVSSRHDKTQRQHKQGQQPSTRARTHTHTQNAPHACLPSNLFDEACPEIPWMGKMKDECESNGEALGWEEEVVVMR